ncbi:MAG TPA: hypothetical protein VFE65_27400 [Pseudonocardia sp.]|jgi:hypothetical protein|nr:hypothetical protein [Pseudonocardia sp.]
MVRYSRNEIRDASGFVFILLYIGLFIACCAVRSPALATMFGWLASLAFIASVYALITAIIALPTELRKQRPSEELPPLSSRSMPPAPYSSNTPTSGQSP